MRVASFLLLALCLLPAGMAQAHSGAGATGSDSGIAIPSVTHGQMAVISGFSAEITDLAARQSTPDQDFRRILNYARIQRSYCGWGLVPRGISDEASPFNGCSHAYLAAAQNLLVRMTALPQPDPRATALARAVDAAMMQDGTALSLCAYSEEPFNTAALVKPDWAAVPSHLPSFAALLALVLAVSGMVGVAGRVLRAPQGTLPPG